MGTKAQRHIHLAVIHCSDSPDQHYVTAEDIHDWHISEPRNWDGIGYHHIIERDGTIRDGRPHYWRGAHVHGYNSNSIGICVVGRDAYTPEQYKALDHLYRKLNKQYSGLAWKGHRELDPYKTCPNDALMNWLEGKRK